MTYNITQLIAVFGLFEVRLLSIGHGSRKIWLCIAPSTSGEVIAYLRTNGGPVPVGSFDGNSWHLGPDAFYEDVPADTLSLMASEGITADAIRDSDATGETSPIFAARISLAEAIEAATAVKEAA